MAGHEAEEMREEPRATGVDFDIDVELTVNGSSFSGMGHDLSITGVFISTMRDLPVGSVVSLRFRLPAGLVLCDGVVRRVRPAGEGVTGGLGIAFEHLSELDRDLIQETCDERGPRHSGVSHRPVR